MKQFTDDDIEVLGANAPATQPSAPVAALRRSSYRWLWFLLIVLGTVVAWLVYRTVFRTPVVQQVELAVSPVSDVIQPCDSTHIEEAIPVPRLEMLCDTINDVPFTYCSLAGLRASLSFQLPDTTDTSIMLVVTAADVRRDNGAIVGDYVFEGEQLSRGERKHGYFYIAPDGQWQVGTEAASETVRRARAEGGSLFRQYALVMEGEVQENRLRGKSLRRAIGFLESTPTFVMSRERESIYDFSQALADYGFSHALYLPGGEGQLFLRTTTPLPFPPLCLTYANANYLVLSR